jgi:hypothetical protein
MGCQDYIFGLELAVSPPCGFHQMDTSNFTGDYPAEL